MTISPDYDFHELTGGSLTLVFAKNSRAFDHLVANVDGQWHAGALAVENRYAPDLSASLCLDGFSVELPNGRVVTAADLVGGVQ